MNVDFRRERAWWDAKAPKEERDSADEAVNRALRWREIERRLEGVETILEIGGGTGAFSIPLARRGYEVTHLDLSPAMLDLARQKAEGLPNIRFLEGNSTDLSRFPDRFFDLVLNMDGAISFCGSQAERAILEACRVTGKTVILTVSHRAWLAVVWLQASLQTTGQISPAVRVMMERGSWHQDEFPDNTLLSRGSTQDYVGALQAFLPAELGGLLQASGLKVARLGGLGSLANFCGKAAVEQALGDPELLATFLDLCEGYDLEILPDGPGTSQRAGLIAVGERPGS